MEEKQNDVLCGEAALVATASLVFQKMRVDPRLADFIVYAELSELAANLRLFLQGAFGGAEWPEMRVTEDVVAAYDGLAEVLVDALSQPLSLGADVMTSAFDFLMTNMVDDQRVLLFFKGIQGTDGAPADYDVVFEDVAESTTSMPLSSDRDRPIGDGTSIVEVTSRVDATNLEGTAGTVASAPIINMLSFEELHLSEAQINAAQDAWRLFLSTSRSQEAAGEAIYSALFEGDTSLQSLFISPRAV
eukprot:CAMPEP_0194494882 /NCGR_PEP_ID=MMETSP0253-20130528/12657_1 /TAXON_ID=2966 /ORGANISM="Noctiluca scintillans" /LENGTH=245 /DNA_ID=CAMNT_0039336059 /DNA_START=137 /DNA_END=870 /DNA_ORIENTATION=+